MIFNQLAESVHVLKLGWIGIIARLNIPKLQAILGSQRINKQLDCIYAYHTILPMQMVQYTIICHVYMSYIDQLYEVCTSSKQYIQFRNNMC